MIDILFFPRCRVFLVNSMNVEVRCSVVTKFFICIFAKMLNFTKIRLFSVKFPNFSFCEKLLFTQNLVYNIKYDNS